MAEMRHGFKREECNARRQAAAPTRTPRAIGCGVIAPSVPAQARREPVQHSASSPSSGCGCSARSSSLHSSAAHHLPRRWCCLCHLQLSLLGLSLSPLRPPLLLTISILLWLHHRACRSLGRPHPPAHPHPPSPTRCLPRHSFTPPLPPARSKSLSVCLALRIPILSHRLSIFRCRFAKSCTSDTVCLQSSAQLSKSADPPLFGLPVSGEQQDCLHPRAHTPSIHNPSIPNHTTTVPASGQCRYSSSRHSLQHSWTALAR
jgi:hypothetical protein